MLCVFFYDPCIIDNIGRGDTFPGKRRSGENDEEKE